MQSVCEILMRLASAKMSFESSPPSSSSASCPFDDLFSGVVSVHSLVPELHKLKVGVSLTIHRLCFPQQPESKVRFRNDKLVKVKSGLEL